MKMILFISLVMFLGLLVFGILMINENVSDLNTDISTLDPIVKQQEVIGNGSSRYIGESAVAWEFNVTFQDELAVDIKSLNATTFEAFPYSINSTRTSQGGYKWRIILNYTYNGTNYEELYKGNLNKNQLNQTHIINLPYELENITISIGESSTVIHGLAGAVATQFPWNSGLCRTGNGYLHAAWEASGSDWWYGNSTDEGASWDIQELTANTVEQVGMGCFSNGSVYTYGKGGGASSVTDELNIRFGDDDFTSVLEVVDTGTALDTVSCTTDTVDHIHCVWAWADQWYYWNSTMGSAINGGNAGIFDGANSCDIVINHQNNQFVFCRGTDEDDTDMWIGSNNFSTRYQIYDGAGYGGTGDGVSGYFTEFGAQTQLYVSFVDNADAWYCNATSASLYTSWSCQELDASTSETAGLFVSNQSHIAVLYASQNSDNGDVYIANTTNNGSSWDVRYQLPPEGSSGFPAVQDSWYPSSNRVTNLGRMIYTSSADVYYLNWTIPFTAPAGEDTCTCPGAGNNWEIDHGDACTISADCDLTTGQLTFTGTGTTTCNARIDTTGMGDPGSGGTLDIGASCQIYTT